MSQKKDDLTLLMWTAVGTFIAGVVLLILLGVIHP